jgi:hypothetical protein
MIDQDSSGLKLDEAQGAASDDQPDDPVAIVTVSLARPSAARARIGSLAHSMDH